MRRIYLAAAAVAAVAAALILLLAGRSPGGAGEPPLPRWLAGAEDAMKVVSPAFPEGGAIPSRYTCDGEDVSPPLEWGHAPPGARALAVLVYDPDAPGGFFIHWLLYGAPPRLTGLPEAVPPEPATRYGAQAVNDFGRVGYGGPCPPPGRRHRYVFLVVALDQPPALGPGAPARAVLEEIRGHVVAYGYTWGVYSRHSQ